VTSKTSYRYRDCLSRSFGKNQSSCRETIGGDLDHQTKYEEESWHNQVAAHSDREHRHKVPEDRWEDMERYRKVRQEVDSTPLAENCLEASVHVGHYQKEASPLQNHPTALAEMTKTGKDHLAQKPSHYENEALQVPAWEAVVLLADMQRHIPDDLMVSFLVRLFHTRALVEVWGSHDSIHVEGDHALVAPTCCIQIPWAVAVHRKAHIFLRVEVHRSIHREEDPVDLP
jgi:hypothetical protein